MTYSIPESGRGYSTDTGVQTWSPAIKRLDICHTNDGHIVLTIADGDHPVVTFDLSDVERDHLVRLLNAPPPAADATWPQPAGRPCIDVAPPAAVDAQEVSHAA